MVTFQDLQAVGANEKDRMKFILAAIADHKASELYQLGEVAEDYFRGYNTTIMNAQKFVYNALGRRVPDVYSANHKIACKYYKHFIVQQVLFLLGNGVSFAKPKTKETLGKDFDQRVIEIAFKAKNAGVAYAFWNYDHFEIFPVSKSDDSNDPVFVPIKDEEDNALKAGIRFWQIAPDRPLRCTLFELDGYTEYIRREGEEMSVLQEKQDYKQNIVSSVATGKQIYNGGNYPGFPIIPLFNSFNRSELDGNQFTIDSYDLMLSALVNNVDDANIIYWVIKNCGGMTLEDDERFVEQLKMSHVVHADGDGDGASVDAHKIEAPFEASEAALERLRSQLFDDFMALDIKNIAGGAATATQIEAAYEPLNSITDLFEVQVTEFINSLLGLLGIDDAPTYTRSLIVNQQEAVQTIVAAGSDLPQEYKTRKILEILGDIDKADEVLAQLSREDMSRFPTEPTGEE